MTTADSNGSSCNQYTEMSATVHVSAIIVNWNGATVLEQCLVSLRNQTWPTLEILVVDNASTDDSESVVRRHGARWVPMETNAGLAAAANRGASEARGELLLFLNNDMQFHPEFVAALAAELARHEAAFAADAVQYDWEGVGPVHAASYLSARRPAEASPIEIAPGLFVVQRLLMASGPVFAACAANMMVRRWMFEELGGFDSRMTMGYEDTDLCWRARMRGWDVFFVPSAMCKHRLSAASASPEGSRVRLRGTVAGRLLFASKCLPCSYAGTAWLHSLGGVANDAVRGRWRRVWIRCDALLHCLLSMPAILRERKAGYRALGGTPRRFLSTLVALDPKTEPF